MSVSETKSEIHTLTLVLDHRFKAIEDQLDDSNDMLTMVCDLLKSIDKELAELNQKTASND